MADADAEPRSLDEETRGDPREDDWRAVRCRRKTSTRPSAPRGVAEAEAEETAAAEFAAAAAAERSVVPPTRELYGRFGSKSDRPPGAAPLLPAPREEGADPSDEDLPPAPEEDELPCFVRPRRSRTGAGRDDEDNDLDLTGRDGFPSAAAEAGDGCLQLPVSAPNPANDASFFFALLPSAGVEASFFAFDPDKARSSLLPPPLAAAATLPDFDAAAEDILSSSSLSLLAARSFCSLIRASSSARLFSALSRARRDMVALTSSSGATDAVAVAVAESPPPAELERRGRGAWEVGLTTSDCRPFPAGLSSPPPPPRPEEPRRRCSCVSLRRIPRDDDDTPPRSEEESIDSET